MVDITAKVICDSIGEHSPRLTTFLTRYNKYIHAEHLRHRSMSFCVSSSRAIPVSKNLEEVRSDALRAGPVYWGAEQKGMQSDEELSDERAIEAGWMTTSPKQDAQSAWKSAAEVAVKHAEYMVKTGVHKSIVNRLLEPFLHVNVLVTSCEPGLMNFFGLRLDKAAQPEIRVLAEQMWAAWNESEPRKLEPGQWHLPFIEPELEPVGLAGDALQASIRVSVARCARLSYTSFETGKRSTVEEDLRLYDRLITSRPIHASPAEHQATPDEPRVYDDDIDFGDIGEHEVRSFMKWCKPHLHGNLPGWVQYRKTLPGEAVAELPKAYR
jgi:thymidylate synthase ThyX